MNEHEISRRAMLKGGAARLAQSMERRMNGGASLEPGSTSNVGGAVAS